MGTELVHARIAHAADARPEHPWVTFADGATSTLAELQRLVMAFAAGLQERGVAKGDRVVLMAGNRLEFLVCWFATHASGAIVVPLKTALRGRVLTHQLDLAESKSYRIRD